MSSPHINETATRSQPREAAIGELGEDATIEGVTDSLTQIGIDADRVYYLVGVEGAAVLEKTKGFFSLFDDVIDKPLGALREGKTLVGVFGVAKDSLPEVQEALVSAGVGELHYFGKWTHS